MDYTISNNTMEADSESSTHFCNMGEDFFKEVILKFIFSNHYKPTLPLNPKQQHELRLAAFDIVNKMFLQMYNEPIPPLLMFREVDDEILLSKERCSHHLIETIAKVCAAINQLKSMPKYKHQIFIFLPYLKQLKTILSCFVNDYCCGKIVNKTLKNLTTLIDTGQSSLETIKTLFERVQVMNVFRDDIHLYQCNICHETSAESHFLKPNECCGYKICQACYANLWKFSNLYPVCPVCKQSFKKSSSGK
ncbi:ie-0 [Cryptophlebia peltastica nucleopolyhedrovirus]|uniref:Ie-0 n=1 Tax=Cryptophlebia peltastica nucleopolyhedrovirus TaxID=2304025 RepID=A0A346RNN6_9ABAC|nr:ie-0 [Cryptophlebia peltastica nucleopolyhedrovirus]AXS67683.1 ie-0 [Cryptophlebia peltastica nucleopolyhedrovirus]